MRVLHVAPNVTAAYGGPTYSLIGYAQAALALGMEVTIGAPAYSSGDGDFLRERLQGATLRTFPGYGRGAFIAAPGLWRWMREAVSRFDVVHVHGLLNPVSSVCTSLALSGGVAVVARPFGMLSRYTFAHRRGTLKRLFFRTLDRRNLERVGAVHFTSEQERDEADWHGLELSARARVVPPPWVGASGNVARESRAAGRTVLFLGRLNPVKNLESLIAAWPAVVAAVPGTKLVLAGDGEESYVRHLRSQVESHGVAGSVRFEGFVGGAKKESLLAEAAVLALPSFHENFGVAVLEAIAHGVAVVVSPEVQLASFVRRHGLGLVVPGDAEGVAGGILTLLREPDRRDACARTGPALVAESFSLESVGKKLLSMYESASRVQPSPYNHA
jgi:glycosyltransferase involved in cell wall biosynthesis